MFALRIVFIAIVCSIAVAFRSMAPVRVQTKLHMSIANKAVAAFFAGAIALSPMNAMAKDLENGENVFNANCAACHAGGNNVIQNEKTLRKEALDQYLSGGLKEASIVTQVTNGKNAMPAFGGRLDASEIEDVAAYVFDQATNAKWD